MHAAVEEEAALILGLLAPWGFCGVSDVVLSELKGRLGYRCISSQLQRLQRA